MNTPALHILSGGAALGLVRQLQPAFEARHGCRIEGTFGAVGAMKDKLLAGAPCDLLILSQALIDQLAAGGQAVPDSVTPIGGVMTGVAVKTGEAPPDVRTPEGLKSALLDAPAVYFPDPEKATAGIHFMKVLRTLGVADALQGRLRTFPNGATAMGALAQAPEGGVIGCTQVTEIIITPGVQLVGLLPEAFALRTVYTGAVASAAQQPALARALLQALAGAEATAARRQAGFE